MKDMYPNGRRPSDPRCMIVFFFVGACLFCLGLGLYFGYFMGMMR